jgi:hypothetical protein
MTTIEYAYNRFSTKRFPLPSETQLDELEQRIKVDFPDDYRRFVLDFNGGYFNEPEITPVGEGCPPRFVDILERDWRVALGIRTRRTRVISVV